MKADDTIVVYSTDSGAESSAKEYQKESSLSGGGCFRPRRS